MTSLSPSRSAPGEAFRIRGRNLGSRGRKIPSINRHRAYDLQVISWPRVIPWLFGIRVRIPPDLPAGSYKVLIYYDESRRGGSNSLDFWVTAAPVPFGVTDPYEVQVKSFRAHYDKSSEWETWMMNNRIHYEGAFGIAKEAPSTLIIAFRYDTTPIAYEPPWTSEAQHMSALETLTELTYAGCDFRFVFLGEPDSSYANVIAGIPTNDSFARGRDLYLYYETIVCHEFAHIMGLIHHYGAGTVCAEPFSLSPASC